MLFGGAGGEPQPRLINQTWFWDGVNWTQCQPAQCGGSQPEARQTARMDYDPVAKVLVMFGGAGMD